VIYLTVGTFPVGFDRLVMAVDQLCAQHNVDCIAQISDGQYTPSHMSFKQFFSAEEQQRNIENSQFVISHGGLGIIGDILRQGKPLLVFPRLPEEAAHDQRPAVARLAEIHQFYCSNTEEELNQDFVTLLNQPEGVISYELDSNIPQLISQYLKSI
jgi:UDP-N-acetylglucosamine transferase subunit ALG13